jgi:tRNA U34 5-methylaminomethyl-2-thiouridine-forming methyltransferase MnmC
VARHDEDFDNPVEEVQANARLIAAAPDLLQHLRECQAAAAYLIDPASDIHGRRRVGDLGFYSGRHCQGRREDQ